MWRTSGFGFTISAKVKKATPRQRQSNLLQVVTQWKSETSSNWGRALNSSQVNVFGFSTNPPISRRQSFNAISGLMPRSRIGKPWVRCWPGGRRSVERPSRTGDLSLPASGPERPTPRRAILRAQRSLRSTRLGLGVATIGILTAILGGSSSLLLDVTRFGGKAALILASPGGAADPPLKYSAGRVATFQHGEKSSWFF